MKAGIQEVSDLSEYIEDLEELSSVYSQEYPGLSEYVESLEGMMDTHYLEELAPLITDYFESIGDLVKIEDFEQ